MYYYKIKDIYSLFILILISAIYSVAWIKNGLFLDMEFYWEQYLHLKEYGYTEAVAATFAITGKLEIGILYLYGIIDYLNLLDKFGFLFLMFIVMQGLILLAVKNAVNFSVAPIFVILIFLSYYSFSQNTYFWMQIIGTAIAIYGVTQPKLVIKLLLLAIACAFHYSSILVFSIWLFANFISKKNPAIYLVLVPLIYFGTKYFQEVAAIFSGSGTNDILLDETSYDVVVYSVIFLSIAILLLYRKRFSKKFNSTTFIDFCLIFCFLAISGTGNQYVIRSFTPASLLIPYVLALIRTPLSITMLIASTYPVVGLIFKIFFMDLKVV